MPRQATVVEHSLCCCGFALWICQERIFYPVQIILVTTYGIDMGNDTNVTDGFDLCIVSWVGIKPLELWETGDRRRSRLHHRG